MYVKLLMKNITSIRQTLTKMEVVRKVERLVKQTKNICFFAITLNYSKQTQLIIDTA